jgi:hypothetical protein
MSKTDEDLLEELRICKKIQRCVEIHQYFIDRNDLKDLVDEIMNQKILCFLKIDLSIRQLIYLYEVTPVVGGVTRNLILTKLAEKAKTSSRSDLVKFAETAPYNCKTLLLSLQGEAQ